MKTPEFSSQNAVDRRSFLKRASTGVGAAIIGGAMLSATKHMEAAGTTGDAAVDTDLLVLNFALNLEYLEAEFYTRAVDGIGIADSGVGTNGFGTPGTTTIKANPKVPFQTPAILQYAQEIANDERSHVNTLRAAIAGAGVEPAAYPAIDLQNSFTNAAVAAGVITAGQIFDPFADELSFVIGSFIFEDVGVTAYHGGAGLITNKVYLGAAAGILAVEAYHAAIVRQLLFASGPAAHDAAQKISDLRDLLDGKKDKDQGVTNADGTANIVPTPPSGIAASRSVRQVLNIVYGKVGAPNGLFFPLGMNLPS